ncbi:glycosyltransferase [Schleiferiaceae bacterium]|nr:glycosyltransferase [Schleiferiaceae bacterium]
MFRKVIHSNNVLIRGVKADAKSIRSSWNFRYINDVLKDNSNNEHSLLIFGGILDRTKWLNIDDIKCLVVPCLKIGLSGNDGIIFPLVRVSKLLSDFTLIQHKPYTLAAFFVNLNISKEIVRMSWTHGDSFPTLMKVFAPLNLRYRLLGYLEQDLLSFNSVHLCGSVFERDYLLSMGFKNAILYKGGLSGRYMESSTTSNISDSVIRLIYVGKYYNAKGLKSLLDSLKELDSKRIILRCFGDRISNFPEGYSSLEHIEIHGRISHKEVLSQLQISDYLVLPTELGSRVHVVGGIGHVVLEAMSLGIGVISNNLVHFSGDLTELDNVVIPYNDLKSCLKALKKNSRQDPAELFNVYGPSVSAIELDNAVERAFK